MPEDRVNRTVRADLARSEFSATGEGIVWAVIGTGIDGDHPHFLLHKTLNLPASLRHVDFTEPGDRPGREPRPVDPDLSEREALVDLNGHGTHSAALIAGETPGGKGKTALCGIAPRCKLLSLKAFSEQSAALSEYAVLRALDHVGKVNAEAHRIHGVLLIFKFSADVQHFACGATPVCRAVDGLVSSGVSVIAAAGNEGFDGETRQGRSYSIQDPGNAALAITVGATHRTHPLDYGASYFSSRGPTLDGRAKPDLLAPGERIVSAWPDIAAEGADEPTQTLDGTMSSAAIVAGAAALVLSAFPELHRRPLDLKKCLMSGAVDLDRDRYAQGAGLLDVAGAMNQARAMPLAVKAPAPVAAPAPVIPIPAPGAPGPVDEELQSAPSLAMARSSWRFAVALSFSGRQRRFVQEVAWRLRRLGIAADQIFYDDFYPEVLARPDADDYLIDVYANQSELIVPFLSKAYAESDWTGMEWRAVCGAIEAGRSSQVMLVRLDDIAMPGVRAGASWLDARNSFPQEVAFRIRERLEFERASARATTAGS